MKRFFCLLFGLIFLASFGAPIDNPKLDLIEKHTLDTVENTSKDTWYFITLTISILALIVSYVTYKISRRTLEVSESTLDSQKKTEINTRGWSVKQERFVLKRIAFQLLDNISTLLYIEKYQLHFPKSFLFKDMKINLEQLHINDERIEGLTNRSALYLFYTQLDDYNKYVDRLVRNAEDPTELTIGEADYIIVFNLIFSVKKLFEEMFTSEEKKERRRIRTFFDVKEFSKQITDGVYLSKLLQNLGVDIDEFKKRCNESTIYQYSNVRLNYLMSEAIGMNIQFPEIFDNELWDLLRLISSLPSDHDFGSILSGALEENNTLLKQSPIHKITPDNFNKFECSVDGQDIKLPINNITEEDISTIRDCCLINVLKGFDIKLACYPFYYDEIDGLSFSKEKGGTLFLFDTLNYNYKDIIRGIIRDIDIPINIETYTSLFNIEKRLSYDGFVEKLNIVDKDKLQKQLKIIKQIVMTNNEANSRTMKSTFSVESIDVKYTEECGEKKWYVTISLNEQLSLKIV